MDHVDPLAVPMVSEMPSLDGLGDDVGPKRGDAFAAGITHRGINNPVIPGIAVLARTLSKRVILRRSSFSKLSLVESPGSAWAIAESLLISENQPG